MATYWRVLVVLGFTSLSYAFEANAQVVPGLLAQEKTEAESPPAEDAPPSPNDLHELSRLLSDPRVAAWIGAQAAGQLEHATPNEQAETVFAFNLHEWLGERLEELKANVVRTATVWMNAGKRWSEFRAAWSAAIDVDAALRSLIYVIVFLIIGAGLEWLYWQYIGGTKRRIERSAASNEGRVSSCNSHAGPAHRDWHRAVCRRLPRRFSRL